MPKREGDAPERRRSGAHFFGGCRCDPSGAGQGRRPSVGRCPSFAPGSLVGGSARSCDFPRRLGDGAACGRSGRVEGGGSSGGQTGAVARPSHRQAAAELAVRDPVVARLVRLAGPPRLRPPLESNFAALVRSVVYQQLGGPAASAIHSRVVAALGGHVTPGMVLAAGPDSLRAAGLSGAKVASLVDLATRVERGELDLAPRRLSRLGDDEIVAAVSTVRGIGRWTAEMFLLFQLRRLDVWPTGDLGVRRGYGLAWGRPMPGARELEPLGDAFRPYRSIVAWYCWRACEIFARASTEGLTS